MSIDDVFQSYIIRNKIFELLNDKEKLIFTSCNNFLYSKRLFIVFTKEYFLRKNDVSWKYYDQITKVNSYWSFKFPKNLKTLNLMYYPYPKIKINEGDIPQTLVYLKLDEGVYEDYKDKIPKNAIIEFNPNSSKEDRENQEWRAKRIAYQR